jgi:hypothetical protein
LRTIASSEEVEGVEAEHRNGITELWKRTRWFSCFWMPALMKGKFRLRGLKSIFCVTTESIAIGIWITRIEDDIIED